MESRQEDGPMEDFLRSDHLTDAIFSLTVARSHLRAVSMNPFHWKWVIIALHNAVQGFMVSAAKGSSGLAVLRDRDAKAWHDARSQGKAVAVKGKLRNFLALYELIKSDRMLRYTMSRKFVFTLRHDKSMEALNDIRNDFIHFTPRSWLLELAGLPQIAIDCLDIVSFCGWDSGNILWLNTSAARTRKDVAALLEVFFDLRDKYGEEP